MLASPDTWAMPPLIRSSIKYFGSDTPSVNAQNVDNGLAPKQGKIRLSGAAAAFPALSWLLRAGLAPQPSPPLALLPYGHASSPAPNVPPSSPPTSPTLLPLGPLPRPPSPPPRPLPAVALDAPPLSIAPLRERGRSGPERTALDPCARSAADVSTPGGVELGEDARVESVGSPVSRGPAARFAGCSDPVPATGVGPSPPLRPQSRACAAPPARAGGAGGHGAPLPAAVGPGRLLAPRPAPTVRAWWPPGPHRAVLPPDGESRGPSALRPRPARPSGLLPARESRASRSPAPGRSRACPGVWGGFLA